MRGFCKELAMAHEMAIEFADRSVPRAVPEDTALCLYRITQEALHNVVKHSGGTAGTSRAGHGWRRASSRHHR